MKHQVIIAFAILVFQPWHANLRAQDVVSRACPRPSAGSVVPEPEDLRSRNGVLKVGLTIYDSAEADGSTRYCYVDENGRQSPNLRLNPVDLLIQTSRADTCIPARMRTCAQANR